MTVRVVHIDTRDGGFSREDYETHQHMVSGSRTLAWRDADGRVRTRTYETERRARFVRDHVARTYPDRPPPWFIPGSLA